MLVDTHLFAVRITAHIQRTCKKRFTYALLDGKRV